jgi:hypothetical protein
MVAIPYPARPRRHLNSQKLPTFESVKMRKMPSKRPVQNANWRRRDRDSCPSLVCKANRRVYPIIACSCGSPAPRFMLWLLLAMPIDGDRLPFCGWRSGLHGGECVLWYLSPFRFLYRFWHTSHLYGFSFSMPCVPGYGACVSGLTMENVPSPFSCSR